jgi:hypothetical protein
VRTELRGRKARPITDVTSTALGKEMAVRCRLFGKNSCKKGAMRHIDPLLGNDRGISKYTTAVTGQQLRKQTCSHGNN